MGSTTNPDADENDEGDDDTRTPLAIIASSTYRRRVLGTLSDDGPKTPTQIAETTELGLSHVSGALGELRDIGAVELIVPEATTKGRIYDITDDGEEWLDIAGRPGDDGGDG